MRSAEEIKLIKLLTVSKLGEVWRKPIQPEPSRIDEARKIVESGNFFISWKTSNPTSGEYGGKVGQHNVVVTLKCDEYTPYIDIECDCVWHRQIYYAHGCCEHIVAFAALLEGKTRSVNPMEVLDERERLIIPF